MLTPLWFYHKSSTGGNVTSHRSVYCLLYINIAIPWVVFRGRSCMDGKGDESSPFPSTRWVKFEGERKRWEGVRWTRLGCGWICKEGRVLRELTLEIPSSFDQHKHPRGVILIPLISLPISPKRLGFPYVCLRNTFRGILEGYLVKNFVLGQSSVKLWHEM